MVERLFLAVPWGCLQFVIVVFPDHTHLLFLRKKHLHSTVSLIMRLLHLLLRSYPFPCLARFVIVCRTTEPDQMASDKVSDHDPHCFPFLLKVHGFD